MIKTLLRNTAIYSICLYLLMYIIAGVKISGGIQTVIIGGLALTLMFMILKPVLNVLTFPFNVITLGLFSIVTNAVILYLLTVFVPNISITGFHFRGTSVAGFSISSLELNTLFAFILSAIVLSILSGSIRWLLK